MYILGMLRPFRFSGLDITSFIIRAVVVLLAISIHEMAHGFVAYKLGDPTAKSMGRLSLNPLKHLDPIGAICMLFFGFGWAKPVIVNPYYFKKIKRDTALVSLGGPVSNFILAFIGIAVYKILIVCNTPLNAFTNIVVVFLVNFIYLNIGLGTFNLLPIPPLDGSKIFLPLLSKRLYYDIMQYERLGWLVLVAALSTGVLTPILGTVQQAIFTALAFLVGGL